MKLKFADFQQVTRSHRFASVITCQDLLRRGSLALVRTTLPTDKGVRLLGVTMSNFDQATLSITELPLFVCSEKRDDLSCTGKLLASRRS